MKAEIQDCLRDKFHVGYTAIHNVCDGTVRRLDWSVWDWLDFAAATSIVVVFAVAMAFFAWVIWPDVRCIASAFARDIREALLD